MMTMPYTVKVKSNGANDVHVSIKPQPVATQDEYIKVVAGRFQRALLDDNIRNTIAGRMKLKKELEEILADFHKQGLIKPKEEE